MGSPMALSHLTFSDLERSNSRSPKFEALHCIARKGAELGPMLLLDINRKSYMGSQIALSHLTLSDLKGQIQGHQSFEALHCISRKGAELGPMLLLDINR